MALWGNTDANEAKPKWLTTEQKEDVIANEFGWVAKPGGKFTGNGNANASPEILCFIKGLSGKIGTGDISGIDWITTAFDKSDGGTLSARVHFNEAVTVTGNPKIVVSGTGGRNHNLPYVSGSGTSSLVFTSASISGGASDTNANDVLSFGANCMAQVSGSTIVDTSGDSVATPQTVSSTITAGSTTFPTVTLDNMSLSFGTTAALGAVTAKVHSATVAAGGSGYSVNDVITIANSFGTETGSDNATLKVTAVDSGAVTAVTVQNAGTYTAIASGVAGIGQQSVSPSGGSSATFNLTLGVKSFVVGTAGTNYSGAPQVTFAGTGLTQDRHVCTMAGRAAAITSSAAIGTAAGTITVSA